MNAPGVARRVVLVTGGTGFVGGALVAALTAAGFSVRLLARSDAPTPAGGSLLRGDLADRGALAIAVQDCEAVFHCAAEKSDVTRMEQTNVIGTRNLLDAARVAQVRRFCHLSSVGVIGHVQRRIVDETTPCSPMNAYEETKLRAEQEAARGIPGGRVTILRPTNVFGKTTLAALARPSVTARLRLALKAREQAHFVYVEDVVAAALYLTWREPAPVVDTCIVSSDEDAGNTVGEIQEVIAAHRPGAPRAAVSLPAALPYYLRRLRRGAVNRGDLLYSARRLRDAGFRFPFGLAGGLRHALMT